MIKLEASIPSQEEIDQSNRFLTYLYYIRNLARQIDTNLFLISITKSNSFNSIIGGKCKDYDYLGRLFRNAWYTEIQMLLPKRNNELVPYANHWIPVQGYYAIYILVRAYFFCSGQDISHEHATNLKCISHEIQKRPDLFPCPWNVLCDGDPNIKIPNLINIPEEVSITHISNLKPNSNFWDSYALLLKTTRQRQIETKFDDWRTSNKRVRIPPQIKSKLCNDLPPTSLFNFFYRLRLRSNYIDADSFLIGSLNDNKSNDFYNSLCILVWNTLLVIEVLITRYIGKKEYSNIVLSFTKHDDLKMCKDTVIKRWELFKDLW
ncbi:MAG: hypothetical protein A3J83_08520 [Elusimicrobia bacterium RIFOXYA2_FULL_40_6]|nr:MAG: hypothetical protein A3J83_08520 [Elusimicrobia bacterium RIFOXYA2_FULL_40_6]